MSEPNWINDPFEADRLRENGQHFDQYLEVTPSSRGVLPTGSRFFGCEKPNSDFDYFCRHVSARVMSQKGYKAEGGSGGEGGDDFTSYRKGDVNVIVCHSEEFYQAFKLATVVCKSLHGPAKKRDRITIFRAILYKELPNHMRGCFDDFEL